MTGQRNRWPRGRSLIYPDCLSSVIPRHTLVCLRWLSFRTNHVLCSDVCVMNVTYAALTNYQLKITDSSISVPRLCGMLLGKQNLNFSWTV